MIDVSNPLHDEDQLHDEDKLPDETKQIKLYQRNDLFQIRLTKWRDDVRELLNEKKLQGVDLSDYMTKLIRAAEGLTDPLAAYNQPPKQIEPAHSNSGPVQLSSEQLEQVIRMVTERLASSGITVTTGESQEIPEDQANEEIKDAINSMLDWD